MKDKLLTKDYCALVMANFLLYYGFWLLIPILPMYLTSEAFNCSKDTAGLIISIYTISALIIRPISGYIYDNCKRKPLYIIGYLIFVSVFVGYLSTEAIAIFALLRLLHGFSFGLVTVGGNTIVVDVMPQSRRGEGLGYYGMANNMAMAIGPMTGLILHNNGASYNTIFCCALSVCSIGLIMGSMVHTSYQPPQNRASFKISQIILAKGIPAGLALLLLSIPYGMTTNYIAIYAKEIGLNVETGLFFTITAFGMAIARIIAGKWVDKGYITEIIEYGFIGVISSFIAISLLKNIAEANNTLGIIIFFCIPLVMGISFGVMFPAYNSIFVNLAPKESRGAATSTYLTSWDIGLALGIVLGGYLANHFSFSVAYSVGTTTSILAAVYFKIKVTPHYNANKLIG